MDLNHPRPRATGYGLFESEVAAGEFKVKIASLFVTALFLSGCFRVTKSVWAPPTYLREVQESDHKTIEDAHVVTSASGGTLYLKVQGQIYGWSIPLRALFTPVAMALDIISPLLGGAD